MSVNSSSSIVAYYLNVSVVSKGMGSDMYSTTVLQDLFDLLDPSLVYADALGNVGSTNGSSRLVRRLITTTKAASSSSHNRRH
jgi:hypothetical protein